MAEFVGISSTYIFHHLSDMAQNRLSLDAWSRARNRFIEDLTKEEQVCMNQSFSFCVVSNSNRLNMLYLIIFLFVGIYGSVLSEATCWRAQGCCICKPSNLQKPFFFYTRALFCYCLLMINADFPLPSASLSSSFPRNNFVRCQRCGKDPSSQEQDQRSSHKASALCRSR